MIKQYIGLFFVLTIGVTAGALWLNPPPALVGETPTPAATQAPEIATGDPSTVITAPDRLARLEAEVRVLRQRIATLEQIDHDVIPLTGPTEAVSAPVDQQRLVDNNGSVPVTEGLIAAGVDSYTAEQIARRQSDIELQRLELRDNAIREGYIGTRRYRNESAALRDADVRIKDEVDAAAYDKYLYLTGQPNRVAVDSVLMGSAAEQSGIREGDIILSYQGERLYSGQELRAATIQGQRDESVNVAVQRGDTVITVSVPRGPLGVRLIPRTVNPEES